MRTYGKVTLNGKNWVIEPEPQVSLRIKRVFKRINKASMGRIGLAATPENTRELEWFLMRYPMEMDDSAVARMQELAESHRRTESLVANIMAGNYEAPEFDLAIPPREYQRIAADLAMRTGRLLVADDVGLGKTATAICTFTDPANLPALVVTLTHLPKQWQREINRFAPRLGVHIAKKGTAYDLTIYRKKVVPFPDVIIMNYHKLRGWSETLAGVVKTVIFDECQELRRDVSAKYSAATHVSRAAKLKVGLSATPIYNYGGEIFSVLSAIDRDALGTKTEFHREWCTYGDPEKAKISNPKAFGSYLREHGLMIRRTRSDVGRELESLTKIPHAIDADVAELSRIEDSAAELARIILAQGETKKGAKMQASEELSNILRQATGIAKAPYVADFVRMLVESGESVLLYGWHHEVYSIWQAKLKDLGPAMYTGKQSPTQKAAAKDAFMSGESKVLMMSLRAGAGLDGLQNCCRTVVFGELDWSPGVHDQCVGRVHRDGQKDPVMAYFLISDHGADPIIADVLGIKRAQMQGIRDPNADLIERSNAGGHNAKKLAAEYLKQRGIKEPVAKVIPIKQASEPQTEMFE